MTTPTDPVIEGLQECLAALHAAVFGYPVIGVHLGGDATAARTSEAAHRAVRDAVATELVGLGAVPGAAAPDYRPPVPVTGRAAALRWAIELEDGIAQAYRYLLVCCVRAGSAGTAHRTEALAGLRTAALGESRWRALLTPAAPTTAFPGADRQ